LPSDNEYAFRWIAPFMRDWANAQEQEAQSLKNG
jgi:hypothetical protein